MNFVIEWVKNIYLVSHMYIRFSFVKLSYSSLDKGCNILKHTNTLKQMSTIGSELQYITIPAMNTASIWPHLYCHCVFTSYSRWYWFNAIREEQKEYTSPCNEVKTIQGLIQVLGEVTHLLFRGIHRSEPWRANGGIFALILWGEMAVISPYILIIVRNKPNLALLSESISNKNNCRKTVKCYLIFIQQFTKCLLRHMNGLRYSHCCVLYQHNTSDNTMIHIHALSF